MNAPTKTKKRKHSVDFSKDKTKVQQQHKDETDINHMVRRFHKAGVSPQGLDPNAQYLDNTRIGDYTEMLNQVTHINQQFNKLPSKFRTQFENQPAKMLKYLNDPENLEEAFESGLIDRLPEGFQTKAELEALKDFEKPSTPEEPPTPLEKQIAAAENALKELKNEAKKA